MRAASDRRSALDVDLHHLRPARLHPGCEVDEDYGGANFIFKGYFSTMGMSILWPIRAPARRSNPAQARAARARARWLTRSCSLAPTSVQVSCISASCVLVSKSMGGTNYQNNK